jgi:hypothetical protein
MTREDTMRKIILFVGATALLLTSGCTNFLYQGEMSARDAYGKERQFVLYWSKKDPLIGAATAGPAILLTECSPLTRIDFSERPEGIVFMSSTDRDRLPGQDGTINQNLICGRVTNYARLAEAKEGALSVAILCEPIPNDFAVEPRNYLAAQPQPYSFPIVEKMKKWSLLGETLGGPPVPECRSR